MQTQEQNIITNNNRIVDRFFSPLLSSSQKEETLNHWRQITGDLNINHIKSFEQEKFKKIIESMNLSFIEEGRLNIRHLSLKGHSFLLLPSDIDQFKQLENLELTKNNLFFLPEEMENLSLLREINLRENNFAEIPPVLLSGKMKKLRVIDLAMNNLLALPKQVPSHIKEIVVGCNPINNNPPTIKGFVYSQGVYKRVKKEACLIL